MAQLVAHLHGMQGVRGSNPLSSTNDPLGQRLVAVVPADFSLPRRPTAGCTCSSPPDCAAKVSRRTYDTSNALRTDGVGETVTDDRSTKWARAERAALGLADGGVGVAVRRYYTTVTPVILLIGVAVAVIVVLVFDEPVAWTTTASGALQVSGILTLVYGFVYASKKVNPLVTPDRASVNILLHKDDSRSIRKQINGAAPVQDDQVVVARGVAIQMLQGLALQLSIANGQLMIFAGGIYLGSTFRLFWALLALVSACLLVVMIWHFRKTQRFLKDTEPALVSGDM